MSTWEIVRQQVALSGIVSGKEGLPVRSAEVTATGADTGRPPSTTTTRPDGSYFFTDLPEGAYSVIASAAGSSVQGQVKVEKDAEGTFSNIRLDLRFKT